MSLEDNVDEALIKSLPQNLKDAIDGLLRENVPPDKILAFVAGKTGGPTAVRGGATYLAVQAYLKTKGGST
jgi:hypothetical protein